MSDKPEGFPLALPVSEYPYRTLLFISSYGKVVAYLIALCVLVAGLAIWWSGYGAAWIAAGVFLSGLTLLLMNCLVELVQLIVDTMIPK